MTWLALILYLLPIAARLRHFDDECDEVREGMLDEGEWWPALIPPIAFIMIILWPVECVEAIIEGPKGT